MKTSVTVIDKMLSFLFVFMMVFPFELQFVKLLLAMICLIYSYGNGFVYKSRILGNWFILYLICNFVPFFMGFVMGNPGYSYYFASYFLWPILYFFLFLTINLRFYKTFHLYLKIGTYVVVSIGLIAFFLFNFVGYTGSFLLLLPSYIPNLTLPVVTITEGCVNSIIFLYSYFIVYTLLNKERNYLLLLLCFVFVLITTRRIIYVELILAVVLYFVFAKASHIEVGKKILWTLLILFLVFMVAAVYLIEQFEFFELSEVLDFIDNKSEDSDGLRVDQYNDLIKGWSNHPILGSGTGINASEASSRSEIPGAYELTYVAILFERGIVGFTLYMGLLLFMNIKSLKVLKRYAASRKYLLPMIVAVDMMLVANATNAYTQAFDYLWMLFIVFPLLNIKFYKSHEKDLRCSQSL